MASLRSEEMQTASVDSHDFFDGASQINDSDYLNGIFWPVFWTDKIKDQFHLADDYEDYGYRLSLDRLFRGWLPFVFTFLIKFENLVPSIIFTKVSVVFALLLSRFLYPYRQILVLMRSEPVVDFAENPSIKSYLAEICAT